MQTSEQLRSSIITYRVTLSPIQCLAQYLNHGAFYYGRKFNENLVQFLIFSHPLLILLIYSSNTNRVAEGSIALSHYPVPVFYVSFFGASELNKNHAVGLERKEIFLDVPGY